MKRSLQLWDLADLVLVKSDSSLVIVLSHFMLVSYVHILPRLEQKDIQHPEVAQCEVHKLLQ